MSVFGSAILAKFGSLASRFGGGGGASSLWSGIARVVDQAPWKTAEQLLAERQASRPLHERIHGQVIPVFMGTAPVEGMVFWRDGPHFETTTTTYTETVPFDFNSWRGFPQEITTTTSTTTVRMSFAVAHSFNQFQRPGDLIKVEFDDVVIYDALGGTALKSGITMRVYDGIDNDFDPAMLAKDGAALTPAYHGLRYLFFDDVDLVPMGGAIPASIRILWGDAASASGGTHTAPLIGVPPTYTMEDIFCFDEVLNRFYLVYSDDGTTIQDVIGTTDFSAELEISLAKITGKPIGGDDLFIWAGCALPGSGLILAIGNSDDLNNNFDLLIDPESGNILASYSDGVDEEVAWSCALPFHGVSDTVYIAAGIVNITNNNLGILVSFSAVNVSAGSITKLKHGLSLSPTDGIAPIITPGKADASGTTFFVAQQNSSQTPNTLRKVTFTDLAAPTVELIYTTDTGFQITGTKFDAGLNRLAVSEKSGTTNRVRGVSAANGAVAWTRAMTSGATGEYAVVPGGGAWETQNFTIGVGMRLTARLQPGWCVLDELGGGGKQHLLMEMTRGSFSEIGLVAGAVGDHFDQISGILWRLDTNEWDGSATLQATPGTVTLADELTTFSVYDDNRGGLLTDAQVTTVGLAGITNGGVIIDADTDLRELASRLAELYGVLRVETATGVKWVKKGTDGSYVADFVLTETDLVEEKSGSAVVRIATRDRNPKEIPAEIEVSYISSDAGYEPLPARAAWPQGVFDTALSLLKQSLSVPVILTDQQALELAWGMLSRARAANKTHSLKLRPNRLKAEPSDIFELTAGGQTITGMFTRQSKLPNHALEMSADGYLSTAATTVTADSPVVVVQPTPSFTTKHVFLDGPLLLSAHDGGGAKLIGYSVLTGLDGWVGGALYRRREGEPTWTKVAERAGVRPVVGLLTAALPAPAWPFETDTVNELTFRVIYGDPADIAAQTEAQFYEAASIIAVGAPGRWLFVTWRNKTVNADGSITLDTLRQGLKGSEVHAGTSRAGDSVVLVKSIQAQLVAYELGDLDADVQLKAVAFGADPNGVTGSTFTVSGAADTPRAPGSLDAAIDGSDIDLTWARRSRLAVPSDGDFGDGDEAPLGADLDVYRVEILDGPGGSVLRTYNDVAGEAKTYPAADITTDFGSIPDNLSFRVSQKTSIAGIGYGHVAAHSAALQ